MIDGSEHYRTWQVGFAKDTPFVAVSMFTDSYRAKAERLRASLETFRIAHALFEVPTVHRSISSKGTDALSYCKPRFIAWALRQFGRPILYLDSDCVIRERPELMWALHHERIDFAVYNWLADPMNEAWAPVEETSERTVSGSPRYWRFSHAIDDFSTTQLSCSGAVQYWNNSSPAFTFLENWEKNLVALPRNPDDECLHFTFNHPFGDMKAMRYFWLPKEYARYAHWIYVRPIVDHPDIAYFDSTHFDFLGRNAFDPAQIIPAIGKARPFPRACIIDAAAGLMLLRDLEGELHPIARLSMQLHL